MISSIYERAAAKPARWMLLTACALAFWACAGSGPVARVIRVDKGLDEAVTAQLNEIRSGSAGESGRMPGVVTQAPGYTVAQYLALKGGDVPSEGDYRVGGYDILRITVYEEPDLSRENVRVSADGFISLPLIGQLQVADRTPSEIGRLVAKRLADEKYLLDAHVSVEITGYNSRQFTVLGAVHTPGSFPLKGHERVMDALALAGGVAFDQSSREILLIRTAGYAGEGHDKVVIRISLPDLLGGRDQTSNLLLAEGDTLYIPNMEFYYIIGQVAKPGKYPYLDKKITIVEALSTAGGFTPIAARNRTRIVRMENGHQIVVEVRVDAITKSGLKGQDVPILPGDVIVVPESIF